MSQKILCATSIGSHPLAVHLDSVVALSLAVRGASPHMLLCNHALPACELAMYTNINSNNPPSDYTPSKQHCAECFAAGTARYQQLPFPLLKYSEFLDESDYAFADRESANASLNDCFTYPGPEGVSLGEQARAGVIRYFGSSALPDEDPHMLLQTARSYLKGAILTARMIEKLIERVKPDCVVNHHGVYVPQGVIDDIVRAKGMRLVVWGTSPRDCTFIFSHGDTYHRTINYEPNSAWETMAWDGWKDKHITEYLDARKNGKGDWKWVTDIRGGNSLEIPLFKDLGLDPAKPTYVLLTNIGWDAQLYYANLAFPSMVDWLRDSISHFMNRPDQQLVVRIHPFEVKTGNREFAGDVIKKYFPNLPKNIAIVERTSKYSTYALCSVARAVLIYGTKAGIELAAMGIPVVAAADAWVKGKGFSVDANSPEEYREILNDLDDIKPLTDEQLRRAKMYAFHYFFRKMIPISSFVRNEAFPPPLGITSVEQLGASHDRGLDVICDGILHGRPFIYEPTESDPML